VVVRRVVAGRETVVRAVLPVVPARTFLVAESIVVSPRSSGDTTWLGCAWLASARSFFSASSICLSPRLHAAISATVGIATSLMTFSRICFLQEYTPPIQRLSPFEWHCLCQPLKG